MFRLKTYFNPKTNTLVEQYKFGQTKQEPEETIAHYVTRLRIIATYCGFHDDNHEIIKQVIQSCYSSKHRKELLKKQDLDITKLLEIGHIHDTIGFNVQLVEGNLDQDQNNRIDAISRRANKTQKGNDSKSCYRCGDKYKSKNN
jgi:hypothetical protein